MPTIEFVREKRVIEVEQGVNLREAAIREYISLYPHILKILNCRGWVFYFLETRAAKSKEGKSTQKGDLGEAEQPVLFPTKVL